MVKTKISTKQKKSSKNTELKINLENLISYSPTAELADENFIGKAIIECLKNNDPEGVIEIIAIHLEALNKLQSAKQVNLPRSTMYHSMHSKNPTIKTLAKLVHASTLNAQKPIK
jgi:DNA-binding phage protein